MEVQWYGSDNAGSTDTKVSVRKSLSAEELKELRDAGFTGVAAQAEPTDGWTALRRVSHPMTIAEMNVYRFWYKRRIGTEDYTGELPSGAAKRVTELKKSKHFVAFSIWIAKNGEAMLVGLLQAYQGKEPQTCIVGRWNANGPLTSFEVMQQAYKRRHRLIWTALASVLVLTLAGLITLFLLIPDGERSTSKPDNDMFPFPLAFFPLLGALYMMRSKKKKVQCIDPRYVPSAVNDAAVATASNTSDGR